MVLLFCAFLVCRRTRKTKRENVRFNLFGIKNKKVHINDLRQVAGSELEMGCGAVVALPVILGHFVLYGWYGTI